MREGGGRDRRGMKRWRKNIGEENRWKKGEGGRKRRKEKEEGR